MMKAESSRAMRRKVNKVLSVQKVDVALEELHKMGFILSKDNIVFEIMACALNGITQILSRRIIFFCTSI